MRTGLVVSAIVLASCATETPAPPIYPADGAAARRLGQVALSKQVTVPDNFVLRPDEFGAVTIDHGRGVILVGSREGTLLSLDQHDGTVRWERALGGAVASTPVLAELPEGAAEERPRTLVIVGTDNGTVHAIDVDARTELWRYETAGRVRNAALVVGDIVYIVNSRDQIYALDLRTGAWRWQYEQDFQSGFTVFGRAGLAFVPAAEDSDEAGTIFTGFDSGKVVALGARSGEALWVASVAPAEGGDFADCDSTPLVDPARGEVIVAGQSTGVWSLAIGDGAVRWHHRTRAVGGVVAAGDVLLAPSSLEGMIALDRDGVRLWRTQVDPGVLSSPIVVGDTAFSTHSEQGLVAFDVPTGELLGTLWVGSGMSGSPVWDALTRRVFAITNRGLLLGVLVDASLLPSDEA
jgi:outer membrane protein assembly factor BamB